MTEPLYIWIVRWAEFQHYKPSRERGPAWIKDYTAQMSDERYLNLTDRQRALLRDLRDVFATNRGRLSDDTRMITRQRCSQTRRSDLDALNRAGFILYLSRESLERALEKFYSRSRSKEVEKEEPSVLPSVVHDVEKNGRTETDDIDFGQTLHLEGCVLPGGHSGPCSTEPPSNLQRRLAEEIARRTKEAMT